MKENLICLGSSSVSHHHKDLQWCSSSSSNNSHVFIPTPKTEEIICISSSKYVLHISFRFIKSYLKDNDVSIKIPEETYRLGLEHYRNNLHGILIISKGNVALKASKSRDKLMKWRSQITIWDLTPLGRGYFEFPFKSREDIDKVWNVGTWNVNPSLMCLSAWTLDFKT